MNIELISNIYKIISAFILLTIAIFEFKNKKSYMLLLGIVNIPIVFFLFSKIMMTSESQIYQLTLLCIPTLYDKYFTVIELMFVISYALAVFFAVLYGEKYIEYGETLKTLLVVMTIIIISIGIRNVQYILLEYNHYIFTFYLYRYFLLPMFFLTIFLFKKIKNIKIMSNIALVLSSLFIVSFIAIKTIYPNDIYINIKEVMKVLIPIIIGVSCYYMIILSEIGDKNIMKNVKLYLMSIYGLIIFLPTMFLLIEKLTGKGMDIFVSIICAVLGAILFWVMNKVVAYTKKEIDKI